MRQIYTLILRVMVDTEMPSSLHGTVQILPAGEPQPFQNADGMAALLREVVQRLQEAELVSEKGKES